MTGAAEVLDALLRGREVSGEDRSSLASAISGILGAKVYPDSLLAARGGLYGLAKGGDGRRLVVSAVPAREGRPALAAAGKGLGGFCLKTSPWDHEAADRMRKLVPRAGPSRLGGGPSVGLGDRLGVATPGHARGVKGSGLPPAFAQQSAREMARTGRSPGEVLDDATWGAMLAGWRGRWGADADHMKSASEIDPCVEAGFTMFTLDPGEEVDDAASSDSPDVVARKLKEVPWDGLETALDEARGRHVRSPDDEEPFARAAVKYGRAVAKAVELARHVSERLSGKKFDLEVSFDETASPTTPFEHRFAVTELRRSGIELWSMAVRFVGEFEKAVDYRGDLKELAEQAGSHARIARELGPYKLSVHSGSDKFSAYPVLAEACRGEIHLKTAGTSYLDALKAIAASDPGLFREIVEVARSKYEEDRRSYFVSAGASDLPDPSTKQEAEALFCQDGPRQVLHVTYGSVLGALGERIRRALESAEELYWSILAENVKRHIEPFRPRER